LFFFLILKLALVLRHGRRQKELMLIPTVISVASAAVSSGNEFAA